MYHLLLQSVNPRFAHSMLMILRDNSCVSINQLIIETERGCGHDSLLVWAA
jgi:hypothetical protein